MEEEEPSVFNLSTEEPKHEVKPGIIDESIEEKKPQKQPQPSADQKKEMTSLDLKFSVRELKENIIGGMFKKIYQYGDSKTKQMLFEIYIPQKGNVKLFFDESKLFLTKNKEIVPVEPPSFCMFLRKHLMGKKIKDVYQHGFDRIVEIKTTDNIIILEMIKPGNVILCDQMYNVIMPLEVQKWKDREIRPKLSYKYPPGQINPFSIRFDAFKDKAATSDKKTVVFLATEMGFGGMYSKELCKRTGIDEERPITSLNIEELISLYKYIQALSTTAISPVIYDNAVSPFPLKIYSDKTAKDKASFSDALDDYFSEIRIIAKKQEEVKEKEEEIERVERIIETHDEAKEKWEKLKNDSREKGEIIYNFYSVLESILNSIRSAKETNMPWEEVKAMIKNSPDGEKVKEIRENEGILVVELGGKNIEIDFRKSIEENASKYFESAKTAKKKLEGISESEIGRKEELEELKEEGEKIKEGLGSFMLTEHKEDDKPNMSIEPVVSDTKVTPKEEDNEANDVEKILMEKKVTDALEGGDEDIERPIEKPKWYEKYKWFVSSDGFIVIAGKNADQNEDIVKKHTDSNDLVYHADIAGAAFVVIKNEENQESIPDETRKEAAEFAAANSKAWSRGLGVVDVYAVKPEQVSKTPPSGEFLPKGSFMIKGERVWYRNTELKLSIGVKVDKELENTKLLSGPVMATRINSDYFVTIKPGFKKATELSRAIKNKILIKARPEDKFLIEKIKLDEFEKMIPSGTGEIVEYG